MVSAVIAKIIAMQQSLTVSENEIAQYVINNADAVVVSTITTIAKNTNTSEASINRFCKKIGYKGFNSFKIALAQDNFFNSMQESRKGASDSFIASVSQDYQHMLSNTTAMLDEPLVFQVSDAIRRAPRIYIFSVAYTAFVAQDLEFKLNLVGLQAKAVSDMSQIRLHAGFVQEGDLIITLAPTIMIRELYHALSLCKEKGAAILTITSYDSPKLNALVDYKFIISDKITASNSVSLSNNIVYLYVTDVIYCTLLERDKTLKQRRLNSDSILNSQHPTDPYLFEF